MKTLRMWVTKRRLVFAAVGLLAFILVWWIAAYPRGRIAARIDLARGHYEVQTFGYPVPWAREYWQLLRERYGVEVKGAGCLVSDDLVWYVEGYNSVAQSSIEERFGKDIFAECWDEARAAWNREHGNE